MCEQIPTGIFKQTKFDIVNSITSRTSRFDIKFFRNAPIKEFFVMQSGESFLLLNKILRNIPVGSRATDRHSTNTELSRQPLLNFKIC